MIVVYIALFMVVIAIIIAASTKGSSTDGKPSNSKSFETNLELNKALKLIIQYAQNNDYKVDDFDAEKSIVVLCDGTSLTSYGNTYPIFLSKKDENTTLIEVGIKSKFASTVSAGSLHDKCFNGIRTAIFAAS